jgi:uncharacterized protein YyaL (SSP411 family)
MTTKPNRLAGSTSPYLLQHQFNPVDWYPWGEEALEQARLADKPIFLSIGYSACHWCHVMEHESFESQRIADILNRYFIAIKVDREQRPDLDQIYMQVVQMLTGSGGWPMSVFLTPEGKPFFGGTYWPPENRWGRPGFDTVLNSVAEAWDQRRSAIANQAEEIVGHLQSAVASSGDGQGALTPQEGHAIMVGAEQELLRSFDPAWGGFGEAPKFPHAMDLRFLMRRQATAVSAERLKAIVRTLDGMADGGIYDHLAGGFARYSVDEKWLVPHFEKMLYDNALLASTYLEAYRLTGNRRYREVTCEVLDYVLRDMCDPRGGFYSAEDADSEGEEGKFYVWSKEEIERTLSHQAELFCQFYGVTPGGNFEGHNILHRPRSLGDQAVALGYTEPVLAELLAELRGRLLAARAARVRPLRDDKVLVSWNALMIAALAEAGAVMNESVYLEAAGRAADFLLEELRDAACPLLHVWRGGRGEIPAFLDDYAYLAAALISLWEHTQEPRWLEGAQRLVEAMLERFASDEPGLLYFTARDAEPLITRPKDIQDGSVPSGNSMAAWALLRLSSWLGLDRYRARARSMLEATLGLLQRAPLAGGQWLSVLQMLMEEEETWVILTRQGRQQQAELRRAISTRYAPSRRLCLIPVGADGQAPERIKDLIPHWLEGRRLASDQECILFRCRGQSCLPPVVGSVAILEALP